MSQDKLPWNLANKLRKMKQNYTNLYPTVSLIRRKKDDSITSSLDETLEEFAKDLFPDNVATEDSQYQRDIFETKSMIGLIC